MFVVPKLEVCVVHDVAPIIGLFGDNGYNFLARALFLGNGVVLFDHDLSSMFLFPIGKKT